MHTPSYTQDEDEDEGGEGDEDDDEDALEEALLQGGRPAQRKQSLWTCQAFAAAAAAAAAIAVKAAWHWLLQAP